MLLSCSQIRSLEDAAFQRGISDHQLMQQAGEGLAAVISQFFPQPGHAILFFGKGNNAGDVLVAGQILSALGWSLALDCPFAPESLTDLPAFHLQSLKNLLTVKHSSLAYALSGEYQTLLHQHKPGKALIALDGLLGIGMQGNPRPPLAAAIQKLNTIRWQYSAFVFSADVPSGLNADTGEPATPCVRADCTISIGFGKLGLVADEATDYVGRLAVVPLKDLTAWNSPPSCGADPIHPSKNTPELRLILPDSLRQSLPPRNFDTHKGHWGRVSIVAGSRGFLGAARLCAEAAVRSGAGLVTLYALPDVYPLLAISCIPEIMVQPVASDAALLAELMDKENGNREITKEGKGQNHNAGDAHRNPSSAHSHALALGPGLGSDRDAVILHLFQHCPSPAVIDADALNALARHPEALQPWAFQATSKGASDFYPCPRLLTPHPGEMTRLFAHLKPPSPRSLSRQEIAQQFVEVYHLTLVLKGARTLITQKEYPLFFNTTGHPGMGSGGMGDVLTGVCATFLAQGFTGIQAAQLACWLCGRAAELAVCAHPVSQESEESVCASSVIQYLGAAVMALRYGAF